MKVLTLDLSTKSSGWCLGQNQKILQHGCITVSSSSNVVKRIIEMREKISKIIKENKIDLIVAEQVRPDYNLHTGIVLRWLQGIIVVATYEINPKIQLKFLNANEWRAILKMHQGRGIKRQYLKNQDMQYVKQKYGLEVNDDEADAICLFDAYWIKQNNEINWN